MSEDDKQYILDNIHSLNFGVTDFFRNNTNFNKEEVLSFLSLKLHNYIEIEDNRLSLYNKLKDNEFKKSKIVEIANEFQVYKTDLQKFFRQFILQKSFNQYVNNIDELTTLVLDELKNKAILKKEFKFIESDYKKILEKSLYVSLKSGFTDNLTNINFGVMVANAGDAAEFLFVARAMLAGYNCSSVDVRSSRYDAIIDFEGTLLRVQIKGIASNQVHFKDRDRGGQGIDYSHERNRGQRITSSDCDIYVAVDKQIGIVYIIPMYEVDEFEEDDLTKKTTDLDNYKENWEVVHSVAEHKNNT